MNYDNMPDYDYGDATDYYYELYRDWKYEHEI